MYGRAPLRPIRQQTDGRYLGRGIRSTPVPGEAPYYAEARRPFIRSLMLVARCPIQSQLDGNAIRTSLREKRSKIQQRGFVFHQLEAQSPPHRQVVTNRLSDVVHRTPPGHGSASECSAVTSTLA